jgi:hypothetical protein
MIGFVRASRTQRPVDACSCLIDKVRMGPSDTRDSSRSSRILSNINY